MSVPGTVRRSLAESIRVAAERTRRVPGRLPVAAVFGHRRNGRGLR